jgi:hypothetical protein
MKLAVMQPYFFPYLGYWQLINAVDKFVIFDDVNFIKKGYINRNNILVDGKANRVTLQLVKASQNKLINAIEIGDNRQELLKTISHAYKKAPYFSEVYPLLENIFLNTDPNLARYLGNSLQTISKYLDLKTSFIFSSDINKNNDLKGKDKILDICKALNADHYINAIGGKELYDKEFFLRDNIMLSFIKTHMFQYRQFNDEFIPNLSIIDVMMFNSQYEVSALLEKYSFE